MQSKVDEVESSLQQAVNKRAEKGATEASLAKKSDKSEFLLLKENVYRRIDEIQASSNGLAPISFSGETVGNSDLAKLNERFDILYRQFQDLSLATRTLVPRTEVEEAMQGVLLEIKRVRATTLDKKAVDRLIERKTDHKEFQEMINALSGSLEGTQALNHKFFCCRDD